MGRLTDIGKSYGTDKAEHHGFTQFYEEHFKKFKKPNILEVGILDGASLRTYDDYYFKEAKIVGIDINNKEHLTTPTTKILQGDIMQDKAIQLCKGAIPEKELYDIIIDDGGHYMEQQQVTLYALWNLLKPGGIFVVEDLHTSGIPDYNPHHTTTTLDLLTGMREKEYKHSLYLTIHQQKELSNEIDDIIIWSKERVGTYGQTQTPSITSVITKKKNLANGGQVGRDKEDDLIINAVTYKQKQEEFVDNSKSKTKDKTTEINTNRFKKQVTVYEDNNSDKETTEKISSDSINTIAEIDSIEQELKSTCSVLQLLITRLSNIKKSLKK